MLRPLLLSVLLVVLFGCTKKSDPDPRDQYLGTYLMSATVSTQTGSSSPVTSVRANAGTFTITKNTDATGILIVDDGSGSTDATREKIPAILSGNTFTISKYIISIDPGTTGGTRVALDLTGSGSFIGKTLLMNLQGVYVYSGRTTTTDIAYNGTKM